jgi:hypothetical protein
LSRRRFEGVIVVTQGALTVFSRTGLLAAFVFLGGCITLLPPIPSDPVACPVDRLPPINIAIRDEAYTYRELERIKWLKAAMKQQPFVDEVDFWAGHLPLRISITDVKRDGGDISLLDIPRLFITIFGAVVVPVPAHSTGTHRVRVLYLQEEIFTQSYSYDYRHKSFLWYEPSYSRPPKPVIDDLASRILRDLCDSIVAPSETGTSNQIEI